MRYMLDTDICIYTINERPAAVLRAFRQYQSAGLGISSVTAAELFFGVARTGSLVVPIARRIDNRPGSPTRQGLDQPGLDVRVGEARGY